MYEIIYLFEDLYKKVAITSTSQPFLCLLLGFLRRNLFLCTLKSLKNERICSEVILAASLDWPMQKKQ